MARIVSTRDLNGRGYFAEIDIGSSARPQLTLIFVPMGCQFTGTLDFIAYFHGNQNPDIRQYFIESSKRGIWSGLEFSMKAVILAAPGLGASPEHLTRLARATSDGTTLGFPDWIDEVIATVSDVGGLTNGPPGRCAPRPLHTAPLATPPARPQLGNLILAGHSAGGLPLVTCARMAHRYSDNVKECWCFDGFYYGSHPWISWARHNPTRRLRGYYTEGRSAGHAVDIMNARLPNVSLLRDPLGQSGHGSEPSRYLGELARSSTSLR